jgi:hypothetical protein
MSFLSLLSNFSVRDLISVPEGFIKPCHQEYPLSRNSITMIIRTVTFIHPFPIIGLQEYLYKNKGRNGELCIRSKVLQ